MKSLFSVFLRKAFYLTHLSFLSLLCYSIVNLFCVFFFYFSYTDTANNTKILTFLISEIGDINKFFFMNLKAKILAACVLKEILDFWRQSELLESFFSTHIYTYTVWGPFSLKVVVERLVDKQLELPRNWFLLKRKFIVEKSFVCFLAKEYELF